ncbi:HNH endonuclease, partial [Achromobacter xylosoxidans]
GSSRRAVCSWWHPARTWEAGMKLKTLKPRIAMAGSRLAAAPTPSAKRMTGRKLQDRRLRIWSTNPHCAHCGVLTVYPHGFELDHRVPLHAGGSDTDGNCQILCVAVDAQGRKAGCHELKTRVDLGYPNKA